jgi:hypothetical protein
MARDVVTGRRTEPHPARIAIGAAVEMDVVVG